MSARPGALIVDYGGVLTTPIFESFVAFGEEHGMTIEHLRHSLRAMRESSPTDHPIYLVETGRISDEEFNRRLAAALSNGLERPIDPANLKRRMFARVRPEPSMIGAVERVRMFGVPTALLSNSWGSGVDYPHDLLERIFDAVLISARVGLRKPDPKIYLLAAEKLGLEPASCVFVDDLEVNIEGARAVGMTALLHQDPAETIQRLEELFAQPLVG